MIIHDAVLLSAFCDSGLIFHLIFVYSRKCFSQVFMKGFLKVMLISSFGSYFDLMLSQNRCKISHLTFR